MSNRHRHFAHRIRKIRDDDLDGHYLFDGLGSVVAVTNDAGTVVNRYSYDPYGVTTETNYTLGMEPILVGLIAAMLGGLVRLLKRPSQGESEGFWIRRRPWEAAVLAGSIAAFGGGLLTIGFDLIDQSTNRSDDAVTIAVFLGVLVFSVILIHNTVVTRRDERRDSE